MTEHKDIQNPKEFSDKDYKEFHYKLMDEYTSTEELKEICMTLAHLPTINAKNILNEFKNSERADEVEWLDIAMDENEFLLMTPENEEEERDYMALELIKDIHQEIFELDEQIDELRDTIAKNKIRVEAYKQLSSEFEVKKDIKNLEKTIQSDQVKLEDSQVEIFFKQNVCDTIHESIKTEKYKDMGLSETDSFLEDDEIDSIPF